jgi:hypothetical protein
MGGKSTRATGGDREFGAHGPVFHPKDADILKRTTSLR